jgi:hypothetical protein
VRYPSADTGERQYWDFMVVEDAAKKAAIGGYYRQA